ncbi:NAD(P)-dependent alcohol dehydrogenase [Haliscomenobacter hydrossis]|uniref:Alcohol dehydrogenase zinc-binding domain protein n=1 Tax=Haliscomenobacter hydrossis (strain ATCC 27775 / DSM 1100 / LMG 10767 / O) TaxID=760192 RepID=F4L700_HALH1|nr:NAD(P)-dependent alcohol dehydrogenase [Haliscomenobacter hydrossis]AEE51955.1 Alcohol dehydrogenase zinc-binding domain protein [Haliscomenobacter hydrossis DSM 1100]
MKAAIRYQYGPPQLLSIGEVPQPVPEAHEILVRVYATTVNRTDCAVLTGWPLAIRAFTGLNKPKLPITGTDFAGQVEAVGQEVSNIKIGDKVWGFNDIGLESHAQYLCIAASGNVLAMPKNTSYEAAVASAEAAHYAVNFLNKIKLHAGQKVLVNGGTGAIGSAAIQLLKAMDVQVTAVCGTPHLAKIQALGADRVIDYTAEDFTQLNEQFDFVLDAVGKSTFFKCKRLLKPGGAYISSELGPGWQNIFLALTTPIIGGKKVIFPIPTDIKKSMLVVKELIEAGKFHPLMDRTYPLEKISEAFEYVGSGQKIGNVIIDLAD